VDRRRAGEVGSDERRLAAFALQEPRELRGGGRLARALEACEQDRVAERLLDSLAAEELRQLLVHDLHDLLPRRQALEDLLAERALAHARGEIADDVEVDVSLEQSEADLAQCARDRLVVEPAALAQVAEGGAEAVGEGIEHGRPGYTPAPLAAPCQDARTKSARPSAWRTSRGSEGSPTAVSLLAGRAATRFSFSARDPSAAQGGVGCLG